MAGRLMEADREIRELQTALSGADEETASLRGQRMELESLNSGLRKLNQGFRDLNEELSAQNEEMAARNAELEEENEALNVDPPAAAVPVLAKGDMDNLMGEIERLSRHNIDVEQQLADLSHRNAQLEEEWFQTPPRFEPGSVHELHWLQGKMAVDREKSRAQAARLIAARIDKQEENECLRAHAARQEADLASLLQEVEGQAVLITELRCERDEQRLVLEDLQAHCEPQPHRTVAHC